MASHITSISIVHPTACLGDLSVRLGRRIGPHRHRVVVEVHWRGAQGWRFISWLAATSNHLGGSFNLLMAATGCLNNPIFSNLGLWAACWAHFMCYHKLWPTSVSHPFSFLNSSLGLTGENITRKLLSLSLDLFFKILLLQVAFLIFFSTTIFSPYFLQVGLLFKS